MYIIGPCAPPPPRRARAVGPHELRACGAGPAGSHSRTQTPESLERGICQTGYSLQLAEHRGPAKPVSGSPPDTPPTAVRRFLARMAKQARSWGWQLRQMDPPHRAVRHFRHLHQLRPIHTDAFGILSAGGKSQPFFLEWERRAVWIGTMSARLAPYLRYYSAHHPVDDPLAEAGFPP